MLLPRDLAITISKLPLHVCSEHFKVHFGLRNPKFGKGLGIDGVRDRVLVLTYLDALERLYEVMASEPWRREPPLTGPDGKTNVYLFDGSPFTAADNDNVPFIALPCRSNEPTTQAELYRAAAEAVHEATHVFNYSLRPYHDVYTDAWEWFDEGTAVLMETLVVAGNTDYFRYLMDWIDMPEVPLDASYAKYQSGMFVRYLAKRLGARFVNDVWTKSRPDEKPLEAMKRLMPEGQVFISSDPDVKDIFASGYCIDPYFLWDHGSAGLAPDVFSRYGGRALSESWILKSGGEEMFCGELDHLACRYYRIYLRGDCRKIVVKMECDTAEGPPTLKAEVAATSLDKIRERVYTLRPATAGEGGTTLSVEIDGLDSENLGHLVLVVSNCGDRSGGGYELDGHDDAKSYKGVIQVL